ncbi:hypothetical protein CROQUDRAFT_659374 [Cronartium quercuum f. sp. fusiforme G11]|uniref:Gamma tubulin complex component C-terminal domain-containing protein n=1 Tax=Cronartium quercuum f. sp. fusiforme G11 TaxID=708437 RepID=A0A9P6NIR6_9BASI|nr:hypothetical protein CROQUDRAFT_659374 [Cronartium quercuum f. sp. fusiforme G11]
MAPTVESINKLIQLLLPISSDRTDAALKRRVHSTLLYPPESEPSRHEVRKRWLRMLERRRIEHQLVLTEELTRMYEELNGILISGKDDTLAKNVDQVLGFLMALHNSPGSEIINIATRWQEDRKKKVQPETEAEANVRLYRSIIFDEPFEGDHWQTDIYAGSSSSYSGSVVSSDWNSTTADAVINQHPILPENLPIEFTSPLVELPQDSDIIQDQDNAQRLDTYKMALNGLEKLAYWSKTETLKPDRKISELIAVREVLSALQALGGDYIFCKSSTEPQTIQLHDDIPTISKHSEITSRSIFKSYIPLLSSLEKLRSLSQTNSQGVQQITRTQEAFTSSLCRLLQRFDIFLTSIELKILNLPITRIHSTFEDSNSGTVISLVRIYNDLESLGWIELLSALASINLGSDTQANQYSEHAAANTRDLLNSVYRIALFFDAHSNCAIAVEESRRVFLDTFEPVWNWIGNWMLHGRLPGGRNSQPIQTENSTEEESISTLPDMSYFEDRDSKEFFIQQTELGTSWKSGDWWQRGHVLRTEFSSTTCQAQDVVPEFLEEFVLEILEGGKARALINILQCDQSEDIVKETWPHLNDILDGDSVAHQETSSPALHHDQPGRLLRSYLLSQSVPDAHSLPHPLPFPRSENSPSITKQPMDFKSNLSSKLESYILGSNQVNHEHLHQRFMSPSQLNSYLIGLNDFFLHGCLCTSFFVKAVLNDIDENSVSSIKPSYFNSKRWWDSQVINQNLSKALELSPHSSFKLCLPKVTVNREQRYETDPIKCLNGIQIDLIIPAPLNYILNEKIILKNYNQIFIILSQLSYSSKILNNLLLIKPNYQFSSINGQTFEQQIESRSFYKLKNRLNWFINLLMDYYMNLIINQWKHKIILQIQNLINLSEKVEKVKHWMKRLISLMFLSEETVPLHRIIIQIFKLCNTCSEVWTAFNRQSNSLAFMNGLDETNIDTERRRRREVRWRKRLEKDQYTLIDDEVGGIELVNPIEEGYEGGAVEDLSIAEVDSPNTTRFSHVPSFIIKTTEDESFGEQFIRMNLEFEKLLGALQRGIGLLGRRSNKYYKTKINLNRFDEDEDGEFGKDKINEDEGKVHDLTGENFVHEQDDLDSLMLFECRLDEWLL